jgi:hypothetical protein
MTQPVRTTPRLGPEVSMIVNIIKLGLVSSHGRARNDKVILAHAINMSVVPFPFTMKRPCISDDCYE